MTYGGGEEARADFDDLLEEDDGGEELGDFEPELAALDAEREELRPVDVGDHVEVRDEDPDERPTLVVLETPIDLTAGEAEVGGRPLLEYEGNEECPEDDPVVRVKYASRTDVKLTDGRLYTYPRSRLEVVHGVHDRDEDDGGDE